MSKPVVVFLDPHGPEVRSAIQAELRVKAPGLVLAPHLAGSVFDNVPNVARHVFGNIRRVLDGEPLPARDLASVSFT